MTFISPGMWKLMAWHQNSPQTNFSSEFEVKEYGRCLWMGLCELLRNSITQYTNDICNAVLAQVLPFPLAVLPSFEVSLRPQKAFFYVNDDSLSVDIEAKYCTFFVLNSMAICMFSNLIASKYKYSCNDVLEYISY